MLGFSHFYRLNTLILGQFPCFSGIFHIKPFDRPIFLNYPENLHWSEEVSRYLFVWTGFLTLSLSIKCRSIISIDAFVLWMPRRVRAGLNMVVYLFCSVVFAMLSVNAWHMVTSSAGQTSPALGLPLAIVYAGPLLGLTLSIFRSLGRIVAETKIVIGKEAP